MGSQQGTPSGGAATPPAPATAVVQALHLVLKNLAIYPSLHPRVTESTAALVAALRRHSSNAARVVVQATGDSLRVGDDVVTEALRLPERFRAAGLRGVVFSPDATDDDVRSFADTLLRARAKAGKDFFRAWPTTNPRVEPLPLVYAGVHADDAAPTPWTHEDHAAVGPDDGSPEPRGRGRLGVRGVVEHLAAQADVQRRLRAIELHACDPGEVGEREVDLLAAIADLLPADVCGDPDEVARAVTQVLSRVERSLAELVRRNARVAGGELLRTALEVARRYFQTGSSTPTPSQDLPTGRPEDAGIVADLALLLQELERLPEADGLCLPPADAFDAGAAAVAQRVCGIVLHALVGFDHPGVAAAARSRLGAIAPQVLRPQLDRYLARDGSAPPVPANGAVRILEALLDAGHLKLVRERGYVDAAFVARGFPHALPLAARVLGTDAPGRRQLRDALQALRPVLQLGGAEAAVRAGVLRQPVVVTALVATGGDVALSLLQQAAIQADDDERRRLLDGARALELPPPEAAALAAVGETDRIPPDYLPLVFAAAARGEFTGPVRAASGAILRDAARRAVATLPQLARLRAVEALLLVPGVETRALLEELARHGRFLHLGSDSRALRACARRALTVLCPKASS